MRGTDHQQSKMFSYLSPEKLSRALLAQLLPTLSMGTKFVLITRFSAAC